MNSSVLLQLMTLLWPDGTDSSGDQVYWLLDGARDPEVSRLVRYGELKFWCLYSGQLTPRLRAAAPYLVQLMPKSPTTIDLLSRGWGRAWGTFIVAPASLDMFRVRLHLKKLLRVQTESGKRLMFRYYDPRVLSVFLPTCTNDELTKFLGPLKSLLVELAEGAGWKRFDTEAETSRITSGRLVPSIAALPQPEAT